MLSRVSGSKRQQPVFNLTAEHRQAAKPEKLVADKASPKDVFAQSAGVLGGTVQVLLKTPRNLMASALLPPRQASEGKGPDIPTMAKDRSLVQISRLTSALGGAIIGSLGGLMLGGLVAPVVGAIAPVVGAGLFLFVDNKLSESAVSQDRAPTYLQGSLAKGDSLANGDSKLKASFKAFTAMTKSSYHEVAEFYSSLVEKHLETGPTKKPNSQESS